MSAELCHTLNLSVPFGGWKALPVDSQEPNAADHLVIEEELRRSENRLKQLVEAGRRLAASLDILTIYRIMTGVVGNVMPCDGFLVSTYHPKTNLITCDYAWVGGNEIDAARMPPVPLAEDTGMQSAVIRSGRPAIFRNVQDRIREPGGRYYEVTPEGEVFRVEQETPHTRCAVMVPVKLEGVVVGAAQVMCDAPDVYSEEHVQLLEGLVYQLAIALENAKLYDRAQQEIAERRRAEEALRISESGLRQTLDAMPQMAWSYLPGAARNYVNRRLLEYSGVPDPDEIRGARRWARLFHPEDAKAARESFLRCVAAGRTWDHEMRLRRADGVYRWHLARMVPIRDADGGIVRWFGTGTDIHDIKLANASLQDQNEDLEQRVRERTRELTEAVREMEGFTYSVSHDLRAPLRAISATSKILLDEAAGLDDDMRRLLDRQGAAAKRLGVLIDQLLDLSRISRHELTRADLDLSRMASDVAAELSRREWPAPPEFKIHDGMRARGDERLILPVLMSLMENAVKFSPQGARVEVGWDGHETFFVRDSGIGFDMKYAAKVWLPFERLVREDQFPGTGIGLANVKRVVERHGGRVSAESAPGRGARFSFNLPQG